MYTLAPHERKFAVMESVSYLLSLLIFASSSAGFKSNQGLQSSAAEGLGSRLASALLAICRNNATTRLAPAESPDKVIVVEGFPGRVDVGKR